MSRIEKKKSRAHLHKLIPRSIGGTDSARARASRHHTSLYFYVKEEALQRKHIIMDATSRDAMHTSSDQSCDLILSGCDTQAAADMRRHILSGILTYAIDEILIHCNDSYVHDFHLSNKLKHLPLDSRMVYDSGVDPPRKSFSLFLHKECPIDYSEGEMSVTSSDIARFVTETNVALFRKQPQQSGENESDPNAEALLQETPFPLPDIHLLNLAPGQTVTIEMKAVAGVGRNHTKWSPSCGVSVRKRPYVKIRSTQRLNEIFDTPHKRRFLINTCPRSVFSVIMPSMPDASSHQKEDEMSQWIRPSTEYSDEVIMSHDIGIEDQSAMDRCSLCMSCTKMTKMIGVERSLIEVGEVDDVHLLHVETKGGLNLDTIVANSFDWLLSKLSQRVDENGERADLPSITIR